MLKPAALGGLFIGILSALPIIGWGNCCCCLWIVTGGALAAYVAGLNQPVSVTPGEGAILGGAAGLIGAFVWIPVSLAMDAVLMPLQNALVGSILENARDLPPEARDVLESFREPASAVGRYVVGFVFMFFAGTVFGALGGLLAAMFFRKDIPPALGGPPAPPPPPAPPAPPLSAPPPPLPAE